VDINVVREGLAMVMDGLRVMENGKAKVSKSTILSDGKICLLPVLNIPGHGIGIIETTVMEGGKPKIVRVFTVDGISVMEGQEK
jgi:hypothetical protein